MSLQPSYIHRNNGQNFYEHNYNKYFVSVFFKKSDQFFLNLDSYEMARHAYAVYSYNLTTDLIPYESYNLTLFFSAHPCLK